MIGMGSASDQDCVASCSRPISLVRINLAVPLIIYLSEPVLPAPIIKVRGEQESTRWAAVVPNRLSAQRKVPSMGRLARLEPINRPMQPGWRMADFTGNFRHWTSRVSRPSRALSEATIPLTDPDQLMRTTPAVEVEAAEQAADHVVPCLAPGYPTFLSCI